MIKPVFTKKDVDAMIALRMRRIDTAMFQRLQRVGESFVNNARSIHTYKDQTGNLRSSIGYLIYKNGREIESNFTESTKGAALKAGIPKSRSKSAAMNEGIKFARQVAAAYPRGYALVVVAGKNYAAAVEARGLDVITGSSLIAADELKKSLAQLITKTVK